MLHAATLEVPDLNETITMSAMKKGLRSSRIIFFLDKKLIRSYSKLLTHAQKYTLAEKQAASQCQAERKLVSKKKKKKNEDNDSRPHNNKYAKTR